MSVRSGAGFDIANEFARVVVSKVHTHNGERLRIYSPTSDRSVDLCALELESLTWQDPDMFSRLLESPFGPSV